MSDQTTIRMTADDYLQLPESNQPQQLINGEVIMSLSPVSGHQRAVFRISKYVDRIKPNGEVFFAPMDVHIDGINVYQPDIFWIAENSLCVERDGYFYGPPDLVIEILSPSTALIDKKDKFKVYQAQSVKEYWLVDILAPYIEIWQLRDGKFTQWGVYGPDEQFTSAVLSTIDCSEIFE